MLNFIGIGAQKAGTTWLFEQLSKHPQVAFPGGKEVHFWDQHYEKGTAWYQGLFSDTSQGTDTPLLFGDITPAYAYLPVEKIRELYSLYPAAKLIFILRNPIDRAWSSAEMARRRAELSSAEASDQWYLDHFRSQGSRNRGDYLQALNTWRSVYPSEQLLVLRFDDLTNSPSDLLTRCAEHLGLDPAPFQDIPEDKLKDPVFAGGQSAVRPSLRPALQRLYTPQIKPLEEALGWDLSDWLAPVPERTKSGRKKKTKPTDRQALFILGMHRSGTSALTRLCNLLGADLGSNLLPAQSDNERGFWENEDLVALNESLLNELGRAWNDPAALPENWINNAILPSVRSEITKVLDRDFSDSAFWAVKDPRLSLLLPLWEELALQQESRVHCLITLRNPLEVAGSLKRRNSLPLEQGLLLWLRYSLSAEALSRGKARAFVTYEQIMGDWETTMTRLGQEMGLTWAQKPADVRPQVSAFLSSDLQHQKADLSALEQAPEVASLVLRAYKALLNLSVKHDDAAALAELDSLQAASALVFEALDPVLAQLTEDNRKAHLEIYPRAHELELELARQQLMITNMGQEQSRLLDRVSDLDQALSREKDTVEQRAAEIAELKSKRDELDLRLQHFQSSTSWKLTAPLRWLVQRVKGS
ncbi:sulfotransferase [Rhodovibrionaceae bacterium A322]